MSTSTAHALTADDEPTTRSNLHIVSDARAESRRSMALLLGSLGYPEEWAEHLERSQHARGKLWRFEQSDRTLS
jgi:hypothetical protein